MMTPDDNRVSLCFFQKNIADSTHLRNALFLKILIMFYVQESLYPFSGKRGEYMRRIVVDMQNFLFADAIARTLRSTDSDFDVRRSESPAKTVGLCSLCQPYALLMEVTGYTPWKLEERLKIRDEVKQQSPHCKIVLIVDENAEKKLAQCVLQAKKDGLIDNFIYGSVSATYLSAVIDTL